MANRTSPETSTWCSRSANASLDNPWAQVGSGAIAWEMSKLGKEPPAPWTIDQILARADVPKPEPPDKYVPKGTCIWFIRS